MRSIWKENNCARPALSTRPAFLALSSFPWRTEGWPCSQLLCTTSAALHKVRTQARSSGPSLKPAVQGRHTEPLLCTVPFVLGQTRFSSLSEATGEGFSMGVLTWPDSSGRLAVNKSLISYRCSLAGANSGTELKGS